MLNRRVTRMSKYVVIRSDRGRGTIRRLLGSVVAAVVTIGMLTATPSSAATPPGNTTIQINGISHLVPVATATKVKSGNFGQLTPAEKDSLGIKPGVHVAGLPQPQLVHGAAASNGLESSRRTSLVVHPDSASGCSGWVCMQIYGSSNYISAWDAQWDDYSYRCTVAYYWWGNNTYMESTNLGCGDGPWSAVWSPARHFQLGLACNTFDGTGNEPCETIKA